MIKEILAYGEMITVTCDERCDLVEFNGTYEGGCGKPI